MLELLNAIIVMHDGLAQANSAVGSGGGGGGGGGGAIARSKFISTIHACVLFQYARTCLGWR